MKAITLENLSPPDLANAADANFITHAGWLQRRHPTMNVIDRDDLVLIDSGLLCDTFNIICRARLGRSAVQERAHKAVNHFRQVHRPFSWWVGPADRPADLSDQLLALGLERAETELAMAADLSVLRSGDLDPQGLRISRVRTESELRAFTRLLAGDPMSQDPHFLRFYDLVSAALMSGDCPLWLYVGYLGDRAVATGELTVGGGVAGLYNIFTASAHRRRGFGTALTLRLLLDAQEVGYRTAVLQAAPQGVSIYERVGFRVFGGIAEFKLAATGSGTD